ncbi:PilZ domain-containing protein [Gilvimarinus agarilyticus]|uniref:PilZ domain-containing protein n=1 Tax=unclassified Gilvimarinus TaxID=2642066 RepID=UPI001C08B3B3|nr:MULTISPECIES: PilZ domain-containing protein [unclassified Gilvimarinus]MBU2885956.1 PilZ domain-containing protein [Gilvimarinus agarilyticus]MDO6570702.1 PilZ domain-containing protein [Gilvimarinus sp. 2_MG-2023]MDO6747705.1 PilZ domain-containing protein [Gilvimarinus sp. 1_MG-2023]
MSLTNKTFEEKRDFIRMKIEAPLEATLSSDTGQHSGECRELSGGGVQLMLDTALPEQSEWELNMASSHGHNPQLRAVVKVVRVIPEGELYATGLQIMDVIR